MTRISKRKLLYITCTKCLNAYILAYEMYKLTVELNDFSLYRISAGVTIFLLKFFPKYGKFHMVAMLV
jgi:hypothetical protein